MSDTFDDFLAAVRSGALDDTPVGDLEEQLQRLHPMGSRPWWGDAYRLAWDRGHAHGFAEVLNELLGAVELAEAVERACAKPDAWYLDWGEGPEVLRSEEAARRLFRDTVSDGLDLDTDEPVLLGKMTIVERWPEVPRG